MLNLELEIIYQDDYYVAINKPNGLPVHKSSYIGNVENYALQWLRNQIGQKVYPCHRLDSKTSGVLLFALNPEANKAMQELFMENKVQKKYLAIVRGHTEETGIIDYPLTNENGKTQEALTHYKTLSQAEINIPSGKFETSRYSLVEVSPQTGRMHQIRKHFAHILHPIIGDRPHGCNKQNRIFKEKFGLSVMLLHASEITFLHPFLNTEIKIKANAPSEFSRISKLLELNFM